MNLEPTDGEAIIDDAEVEFLIGEEDDDAGGGSDFEE
jgi:hypothetical protein